MSPKHGLYLQNSTQYIDDLATPANLVEYAVAAEEAGYDGVFCADVLAADWIDPWVTLSAIAARTTDLTLGTWVTPVARRQPWQLAKDLATLDQLSDGRVMLGAGLGTEEDYTGFGAEWVPKQVAAKYDEGLEIIDGLWGEGPFSYDGDHYTVSEVEMGPKPLQDPRPPIVCGCWWPNKPPMHRGAQWDGIMPFAPSFIGQEGLHGEPVTGTPEEEARDIMEYYHNITDEPGISVLPVDVSEAPDDFGEILTELGVTWLLTSELLAGDDHEQNLERIRAGPPGRE